MFAIIRTADILSETTSVAHCSRSVQQPLYRLTILGSSCYLARRRTTMDCFDSQFLLEELLTSESGFHPKGNVLAAGPPVNFDHKPDGYPGYCVIA